MRRTGNAEAKQLLAGACLRAARQSEARGHLSDSARLWLWYARSDGDAIKAVRNIVRVARNATGEHQHQDSISKALESWRCLFCLEPNSAEAHRGMTWCHRNLAGLAEQAGDFATARLHWKATLQIAPGDESAIEGLRRLGDRGMTELGTAPNSKALRLYKRLKRSTDDRYESLCMAGKLLLDAGAPNFASDFLRRAFEQNAGGEGAVLFFQSSAAMGDHESARQAVASAAQFGSLGAIPPDELQFFLREGVTDVFPDCLLAAIAETQGHNRGIAPALLPQLLSRNLVTSVAPLVDGLEPDGEAWPDALVLETGQLLLQAGERDHALRLFAVFSASPHIASAFRNLAQSYPPNRLQALLSRDGILEDSQSGSVIFALAEALADSGNLLAATEILCRPTGSGECTTAQRLYKDSKQRLCSLVLQILGNARSDRQIRERLATVTASLLPQRVQEFFATPAYETLLAHLVSASHFEHAAPGSSEGILRQGYFEHHLERRENCRVETLASDLGFCAAVLRYFQALSSLRSSEQIPLSTNVRRRLANDSLAFGHNRRADLLMSYAALLEGPKGDLESPDLFSRIGGWYMRDFMPRHHLPPSCLPPDLVAYFTAAQQTHLEMGICITHFADEIASETDSARKYDTSNALDVLLLGLSAVAELLPVNLVYRPLLAALMPAAQEGEISFVDLCIDALKDLASSAPCAIALTEVLANARDFGAAAQIRHSNRSPQQDVLLIGHSGEGTGLNRNFRMLERALTDPGIALSTLWYDMPAEDFAAGLKTWRWSCGANPVVVAAVNAQDIPAVYVRDRHQALEAVHVTGFFLWETSKAPRVQQLGIDLVDEIWTPTEYVARVYAAFAKVHVVGKGLYVSGAILPRNIEAPGTVSFLTVFDFHSSIERKNPLASVSAFRRAFQSNEDVRLVLKASNVNPQHPGNAFGQWERICAAASTDPRIHLITERYSEAQMADLLRETSCVVSLHRSEGFGYVLADAMALGIPVIATDYSGNTDFCNDQTSFPVDYALVPVRSAGAHWEEEGAEWADPNVDSAAARMLEVYRDYPAALVRAGTGQRLVFEKYSTEAFGDTVRRRLAEIRAALSRTRDTAPHEIKAQWH
jgi:glycosyltransferase involved in cell wall biosynthesis